MMSSSTVLYKRDGPVALITLNRPAARNALNSEMLGLLDQVFAQFAADRQVRVAVLAATGEHFSVGADLGDYIPQLTEHGLDVLLTDRSKRFFSDVYKPVVAAVRGSCVAGGLEMLLGTDIRIASDDARFGLGEVRWGVVPAGGSHVRLPRQVPWAIAMEVMLTGNLIDATRAYEVGLVNRVVPVGDELEVALHVAEQLAQNAPMAVQTAKEAAVRSFGLEEPFVLDAALSERVFNTEDAVEGPAAFVGKRLPEYTGRFRRRSSPEPDPNGARDPARVQAEDSAGGSSSGGST